MPKHTIRGGCMIKRTRDQSYVSFYFAAFFIVWSVREFWFVQYMEKLDPASAAILSAIIKIQHLGLAGFSFDSNGRKKESLLLSRVAKQRWKGDKMGNFNFFRFGSLFCCGKCLYY